LRTWDGYLRSWDEDLSGLRAGRAAEWVVSAGVV